MFQNVGLKDDIFEGEGIGMNSKSQNHHSRWSNGFLPLNTLEGVLIRVSPLSISMILLAIHWRLKAIFGGESAHQPPLCGPHKDKEEAIWIGPGVCSSRNKVS